MDSPADHPTRRRLVQQAMLLFGHHGYEGTSTRALARVAECNVASIAYHFGGKEGLRLACADEVAAQIGRVARVLPSPPQPHDRDQARRALRRLIRRVVVFLTAPATDAPVGFLLSELSQPESPVLDRLYGALVEPRHRALCALWQQATGRPAEAEDTRLAMFSLIGQAAYFRLAAPIVQRRMGWPGYDRAAARAIGARLLTNLDAMLEAADG